MTRLTVPKVGHEVAVPPHMLGLDQFSRAPSPDAQMGVPARQQQAHAALAQAPALHRGCQPVRL
jgi:hypothetical protein